MNWNFSIQGSPGTAGNNFVVALYDPSNPSSFPNAPVFQQAITTGFPGPFSITATNLQAIVYNFYLWETSGTVPGGLVRNQFSLQPTIQTLKVRADLYLTTDVSPGLASNSPTYTDPTNSLAGWTYSLEQVGYGTLQVGTGNDYTINGTTGNWTLLAANPFSNQKFVVHFVPQVSNQPISTTTTSIISAIRIINTSTTLTSTDMGKLIAIQGTVTNLTVTLPSVSTFADGQSIFISSTGGVHRNVIIQAAGTEVFQWTQYSNQSTIITQMILGQSEQLLLVKENGAWYVLQASDGIKMVGELLYNYNLTSINTLQCSGQVVNRADYPRLWNFIQKLDASMIVSDAVWNFTATINNQNYFISHGCFSSGDGSTTFRLPQLYDTGFGFLRAVDGVNRKAASYEIETIRQHDHTMHGSGQINDSASSSNPFWYLSNKNGGYSGVGGNLFGRKQSAPDTDMRTGVDCGFGRSSPTETKPTNFGAYLLIRI